MKVIASNTEFSNSLYTCHRTRTRGKRRVPSGSEAFHLRAWEALGMAAEESSVRGGARSRAACDLE